MRVLIACECSGVIREAFRARGHDAYSNDIKPARDGSPFHIQDDARRAVKLGWGLMIAHPDCTFLTISAAWAYKDGPYHQAVKPGTLTGAARRAAQVEAYEFFMELYNAPIPRVAMENPVGVVSTLFRKPDQIIQPYQFGDDASKATCLWLRGLPLLRPTQIVEGREVWHNGRAVRRWANQTDSGQNRLPPSADRAHLRAETYAGVAAAMAEQWGGLAL
jgi:hypothetical protein